MNPTSAVLEERVAASEGGVGALAVSSGQAASAFAIQNIAKTGDNIVSSTDLYGGTWNLFANTLKDQGIEVRFVDPADPQAFARATDAKTRAYYAEALPNPKLVVRSEEHTSELQSLMRISYAVFCLKKKKNKNTSVITTHTKKHT